MNDSYNNCHTYTADYILEKSGDGILKNAVETIRGDRKDNINTDRYWDCLNGIGKTPFDLGSYNSVPDESLILFTFGNKLCHSMIKHADDTWSGANNISSLGIEGAETVNGGHEIGVERYRHMRDRIWKEKKQGGWGSEQKMYSIYGDKYEMYYIPLQQQKDEEHKEGCCNLL